MIAGRGRPGVQRGRTGWWRWGVELAATGWRGDRWAGRGPQHRVLSEAEVGDRVSPVGCPRRLTAATAPENHTHSDQRFRRVGYYYYYVP